MDAQIKPFSGHEFILFNHQGKAQIFIDALAPGYCPISRSQPHQNSAFVLSDNDVLSRRSQLEKLHREGIRKVFIYPHSARPPLAYAFYEPWPGTTAQFVSTDAHAEILQIIGYRGRLHSVGFGLCPVREFQPRAEIHNVLFAPIHPRNSKIDKQVNAAALAALLPLVKAGQIKLTVRYLAPFDGNGIERHDSITYVEGAAAPSLAIKQIDGADLVVGHQTFAFLAVARGIPTLMMGEDVRPHIEFRNGTFLQARGWNEIKDKVIYPLDILNSSNVAELMRRAASDDGEISDWRSRMIGPAFDAPKFLFDLESYL